MGRLLFACVSLSPLFISIGKVVFYSGTTNIAEITNYSKDENRDIINTFDTRKQNTEGFPIDPFDLMNRLKQVGAMNEATTPSDALDEALNAFDESEFYVPIE